MKTLVKNGELFNFGWLVKSEVIDKDGKCIDTDIECFVLNEDVLDKVIEHRKEILTSLYNKRVIVYSMPVLVK